MVGSVTACCVRAPNGQAAAAPPSSVMNWRRPRSRGDYPVLDRSKQIILPLAPTGRAFSIRISGDLRAGCFSESSGDAIPGFFPTIDLAAM
jgi:hypothetical protein